MDRKRASDIVTGVFLIVLGLVFLADRLGIGPLLDFSRLWPLFLVALGLARFFVPREDGTRGGSWLVFLGALFLLNNYGVLSFHQSWPLFIVAGGVSILVSRKPPATEVH